MIMKKRHEIKSTDYQKQMRVYRIQKKEKSSVKIDLGNKRKMSAKRLWHCPCPPEPVPGIGEVSGEGEAPRK